MAALLEGGHFPFDQVSGVFGRHAIPIANVQVWHQNDRCKHADECLMLGRTERSSRRAPRQRFNIHAGPSAQARWEELYALQAEKHRRTTHSSWRLARSYADRGGAGHCGVCKNRWRTPEGDVVAREFGDNNAAGTQS